MVNRFCIISECKAESYPGCGITFHRMPINDEMYEKWIKVISEEVDRKNSAICSLHFKPFDYINKIRKKLKPTAVPSIFPKAIPRKEDLCLMCKGNKFAAITDSENDDSDDPEDPGTSQAPQKIASRNNPRKKVELGVEVSTQTDPLSELARQEELELQVKKFKSQITRQAEKIKKMKYFLKTLRNKCKKQGGNDK